MLNLIYGGFVIVYHESSSSHFLFFLIGPMLESMTNVVVMAVSALNALQQSFGVGELNWPSSTDPCSAPWPGVFCDSSSTNVQML
jgi:hypothetical protein